MVAVGRTLDDVKGWSPTEKRKQVKLSLTMPSRRKKEVRKNFFETGFGTGFETGFESGRFEIGFGTGFASLSLAYQHILKLLLYRS